MADCPDAALLSLATENFDKPMVGLLWARETATPSAGERLQPVFLDLLSSTIYLPLLQYNYSVYTDSGSPG